MVNRNTDFVLVWLHTQLSAQGQVPLFNITGTETQAMNMGKDLQIKPSEMLKQIPLQNFAPFQYFLSL